MKSVSGTRRALRWAGNTLLAVMLVWTLVPFYWMLATSLKKDREIYGYEATLVPRQPTLQNYVRLFDKTPFVKYLRNSAIVSIGNTLASLVLATLGAYALARLRFPGRTLIARGLVFTYLVPPALRFIPLFAVMSALRLVDTHHGLILAYLGFSVPFCTWLLMGYFRSVPLELEEAALVDGCSDFKAMWHISARIVAPGVVTVALFAFLTSWNEFLAPLFILNDGRKFTLPIMLVNIRYASFNILDVDALQAGVVVAIVPCLVVYLALQRFYVRGLVAGALRG